MSEKRSVGEVRREILQVLSEGNARRALKLCLAALKQLPDEAQLWLTLGDICRQTGHTEEAIRAWERAAGVFAASGALIQAISANKLIVEIDPDHARTQEQLASLYGRARASQQTPSRPSFDAVDVDLDELLAEHAIEPATIVEDADAAVSSGASDAPTLIILDDAAPELEILDDDAADVGAVTVELVDALFESNTGWGDPQSDAGELLMDLPHVPIFSELPPDAFVDLVDQIRRTRYFPGEDIVREGDSGDSFYVIAQGAADVVKSGDDGEVLLARLEAGTFFGEIAFLTGSARTATVRAADHCDILEFSRGAMETLMARNPAIRDVIERFCRQRLVDTALKTAPLLACLPADKRTAIARHFRTLAFADGEQVISAGAVARGVYVVVFGAVRIGVESAGPGQAFGASSLLSESPEMEPHVAEGTTLLLELGADVVRKLVERLPAFRAQIDALLQSGI